MNQTAVKPAGETKTTKDDESKYDYDIDKPITLFHTIPSFDDPKKEPFENIVGKEENAGNQHFLLFFHNVFYLSQKNFCF